MSYFFLHVLGVRKPLFDISSDQLYRTSPKPSKSKVGASVRSAFTMNYSSRVYFCCECRLQQSARRFGKKVVAASPLFLLIHYDMFMFKPLEVHSLV